jgi:hypothetical protein
MTTLREQMAPLVKDFQGQNGRGNLLSANITLMKIVDLLMTHIEKQTVQLHDYWHSNQAHPHTVTPNPHQQPGTFFGTLGQDGFDLANTVPVQGWNELVEKHQDDNPYGLEAAFEHARQQDEQVVQVVEDEQQPVEEYSGPYANPKIEAFGQVSQTQAETVLEQDEQPISTEQIISNEEAEVLFEKADEQDRQARDGIVKVPAKRGRKPNQK